MAASTAAPAARGSPTGSVRRRGTSASYSTRTAAGKHADQVASGVGIRPEVRHRRGHAVRELADPIARDRRSRPGRGTLVRDREGPEHQYQFSSGGAPDRRLPPARERQPSPVTSASGVGTLRSAASSTGLSVTHEPMRPSLPSLDTVGPDRRRGVPEIAVQSVGWRGPPGLGHPGSPGAANPERVPAGATAA
jgi:hypothetical protein